MQVIHMHVRILKNAFLPSYKDYTNSAYGFGATSIDDDKAKECKPTDYARANEAFCYYGSSYLYNGCYWTRSPYDSSTSDVSIVNSNGILAWSRVANDSSCRVRPCLSIKI